MAITVDNLNNLFWDNGSWKYPNTYPKLVSGKYLPNVTPVMTSPLTGWIVLEGEWNYALFNEQLYFLKKDKMISLEKNKWRYFLIKDHICTLFRNKANVIAEGTMTNTDLEHLYNKDFQFTFPVFNNYNKRILIPLKQEKWNWRKHIKPTLITKNFDQEYVFGDKEYTDFVNTLEANKELFKTKKIDLKQQKNYKHFTLLGKTNRVKKGKNWKNDLVKKINDFLNAIPDNSNIVLGQIDPNSITGSQVTKNKWAISDKSDRSLVKNIETTKQVLNNALDFSRLQDIVLVRFSDGQKDNMTAYFQNKFEYLGGNIDEYIASGTYIKKLSRRNRTPILNPYTSRAIYRTGDKFSTWFQKKQNSEHLLPQKIFFQLIGSEVKKPLDKYIAWIPRERHTIAFRSVYLYFSWYLDFILQYTEYPLAKRYIFEDKDFVKPEEYFGWGEECKKKISCALASSTVYSDIESKGIRILNSDQYEEYYPWKKGGTLNIENPLNMGWLIGQFSPFLEANKDFFDSSIPFKVKTKKNNLKRLRGFKDIVKGLISEENIFKKVQDPKEHKWELDIFNNLVPRIRQATVEEDFMIGEKLLFTTWGLPSYLLFQPSKYSAYSNFEYKELDKDNQLLGKWLNIKDSWGYAYYLFGADNYLTQHAKDSFKKAYDEFKKLDYKDFYKDKKNFTELTTHIQKNTEAYFETEDITIANTPLKELNKGDIFFSDQEWFFYDASETNTFAQEKGDWFNKEIDNSVDIQTKDILVYFDCEEGKICVGESTVWKDKVKLPKGQFIAVNSQINNPSSSISELDITYYKIKKLSAYETMEALINSIKQDVSQLDQKLFNDIAEIDFEKLEGNTEYLFDLVGTNFYCFLDRNKKVHLIFKQDKDYIDNTELQLYSVEGNDSLDALTKTQWINQQVKLSLFGQKLDLPIKAFEKKVLATISIQTAKIDNQNTFETSEAHKVEIEHDLGTVYFRLIVQKEQTKNQVHLSAFEIEDLNMQHTRVLQNYINNRREYENDFERMELGHKEARFEHFMNLTNSISNLVGSVIGGVAGAAAGGLGQLGGIIMQGAGFAAAGTSAAKVLGNALGGGLSMNSAKQTNAALSSMSQQAGLFKSMTNPITGIFNSSMAVYGAAKRKEFLEEKIGLDLKDKVYQSYNIDLGFQRRKINHAFNLRRAFSQDSYSESTSREKAKKMDALEEELKGKEENEIYLEVWTTSPKQEERVKDYHLKHGVDCRIPNTKLAIKNGIEPGIYQMEDVEISNLKDRIELMFLKARLEIGIKLVEWIEHEKVDELIPVDPRVIKLQKALEISEKLQKKLEQDKFIQQERFKELEKQLADDEEKIEIQKGELEKKENELKNITQQKHELSENYNKLEAKRKETEQVSLLYKEQKEKLEKEKKDLETEKGICDLKVKSLELEIENEKKNSSSLNEQITTLNNEKNQITNELEKSKVELDKQKQIAKNEGMRLKELEAYNEKLKTEGEGVQEKYTKLEEEKKTLEEEKNKINTQLTEAEEKLKTLESEKENLQKELEKEKLEHAGREHGKWWKEHELKEKEKELETIKQEMEKLKKDAKDTEDELNKLKEAQEEGGCVSGFPFGYINKLFIHEAGYRDSTKETSMLLVIPAIIAERDKDEELKLDLKDSFKVLRWSTELQIFMEDPYYDCIWIYDAYKLFYVGNSKMNDAERRSVVIADDYWYNYSTSGYFSKKVTTWADVRHHILNAHKGAGAKICMNWEQINFSNDILDIPYIPKEELRMVGKPWEDNYKLELAQPDQRDDTSLNYEFYGYLNAHNWKWYWDNATKKFFYGPYTLGISAHEELWVVPQIKDEENKKYMTNFFYIYEEFGEERNKKWNFPWFKNAATKLQEKLPENQKDKVYDFMKKIIYFLYSKFMRVEYKKPMDLSKMNSKEVLNMDANTWCRIHKMFFIWNSDGLRELTENNWNWKTFWEDIIDYYLKNIKVIENYGDYRKVLGITPQEKTFTLAEKAFNFSSAFNLKNVLELEQKN